MPRRQTIRVSDAFGLSDSEDESIPRDAKMSNNKGTSTGVTRNVNGTIRSMKYSNNSLMQGYTSVYGGFMHHEKVLEQQPTAESTEGMSSILGSQAPPPPEEEEVKRHRHEDENVTTSNKKRRPAPSEATSSSSATEHRSRQEELQTAAICHLCARKFKSTAHLKKHEELSALHKENLRKKEEANKVC
ncbi:hypothetical protein FOL47_007847 [Perkinsus chesapeaki]|uniref:C2H2-type domain-containing protein n=1 Tax=Perkinsus chesapeaki TaxID=330153 RepID=A0A7J6MUV3_PERCH|nr:hypothetical protein FOL47_007847 [Perkinsus chesapeaki]